MVASGVREIEWSNCVGLTSPGFCILVGSCPGGPRNPPHGPSKSPRRGRARWTSKPTPVKKFGSPRLRTQYENRARRHSPCPLGLYPPMTGRSSRRSCGIGKCSDPGQGATALKSGKTNRLSTRVTNKLEMASRLPVREDFDQLRATQTLDEVLAEIGDALVQSKGVRNVGLASSNDEEPACAYRSQPPHGRKRAETGTDHAVVQGGRGCQGNSEQRLAKRCLQAIAREKSYRAPKIRVIAFWGSPRTVV